MKQFWMHSTSCGMVARSLSAKLNYTWRERDFVGGLLHDFGKLIFTEYFAPQMNTVIDLIRNQSMTDLQAETQVFGALHTDVGSWIATKWGLPVDLVEVILYHHTPRKAPQNKSLTAIVRLADLFCQMWGAGVEEGIGKVVLSEEESWKILQEEKPDLATIDIERFTFELETEFQRAQEFMRLAVEG
jgi:HD-like signal output (HDOD) protein